MLIKNIPLKPFPNNTLYSTFIHYRLIQTSRVFGLQPIITDYELFRKLLMVNRTHCMGYIPKRHACILPKQNTPLYQQHKDFFQAYHHTILCKILKQRILRPDIRLLQQYYYNSQRTLPKLRTTIPISLGIGITNYDGIRTKNHIARLRHLYHFLILIHFGLQTQLDLPVTETIESLKLEQSLTSEILKNTTLSRQITETTIRFIKIAHCFMARMSKKPYYQHPMEVAKILMKVTNDPSIILAGLLHDVVEDTIVTIQQLQDLYGPDVSFLVNMVTRCTHPGHTWYFCDKMGKNLLERCDDIRIVYVKLADRLHNLRTIHFRNVPDQQRVARETLQYYIPFAKHNNVSTWIPEMTNICRNILAQQA